MNRFENLCNERKVDDPEESQRGRAVISEARNEFKRLNKPCDHYSRKQQRRLFEFEEIIRSAMNVVAGKHLNISEEPDEDVNVLRHHLKQDIVRAQTLRGQGSLSKNMLGALCLLAGVGLIVFHVTTGAPLYASIGLLTAISATLFYSGREKNLAKALSSLATMPKTLCNTQK